MRGSVVWTWAVLVALGVALAGCGDSNLFEGQGDEDSLQAQKEDGVEALNDGRWQDAIDIFGALNAESPSAEYQKYLSSAYVGRAGFDSIELVAQIADSQGNDGGASILYDQVTKIFDDGDGVVSSDELAAKLPDVQTAIETLVPKDDTGKYDTTGLTDGQKFQAGLYAALEVVILSAEVLDLPDVSQQTVTALDSTVIDDKVQANFPAVDADLNSALGLVLEGKETLCADVSEEGCNDIEKELDDFLREIGYGGAADPVDAADLSLYLRTL